MQARSQSLSSSLRTEREGPGEQGHSAYVASLNLYEMSISQVTSNNQRLGRCARSVFSRRGWFRDGCTMSRLVV